MNSYPECYGKMFPSIVEFAHNKNVMGRVFEYRLDYTGLAAQTRDAIVDRKAWQGCSECPQMDGCYRLSMGTMLMELAVKTSPSSLYG